MKYFAVRLCNDTAFHIQAPTIFFNYKENWVPKFSCQFSVSLPQKILSVMFLGSGQLEHGVKAMFNLRSRKMLFEIFKFTKAICDRTLEASC